MGSLPGCLAADPSRQFSRRGLGPFRNTKAREADDLDRPSLDRITNPDASIRPDRVMKEPVRCIPNPAHDHLPRREDSEAP